MPQKIYSVAVVPAGRCPTTKEGHKVPLYVVLQFHNIDAKAHKPGDEIPEDAEIELTVHVSGTLAADQLQDIKEAINVALDERIQLAEGSRGEPAAVGRVN